MRRLPSTFLVLATALLTTACIGPARTNRAFAGKAGTTAAVVASNVETARLVARAATAGQAFNPYVSSVLSDAERDAAEVQSTFASIQPPSGRADRIRAHLNALLGDAVDGLARLRIAARRGHLDVLAGISRELDRIARSLHAFADDPR